MTSFTLLSLSISGGVQGVAANMLHPNTLPCNHLLKQISVKAHTNVSECDQCYCCRDPCNISGRLVGGKSHHMLPFYGSRIEAFEINGIEYLIMQQLDWLVLFIFMSRHNLKCCKHFSRYAPPL